MESAGDDQSRCGWVWAMYLVREKFLCLWDLDWNMKELVRRILKKVLAKERRWGDDDLGKPSMMMGVREVRTWKNQNQMGFRVPDIVAGERATGLHCIEKRQDGRKE